MNRSAHNGIYEYIQSLYQMEIAKVRAPSDTSESEKKMQISPLEGMIVATLLKSIQAKTVLEIGTLNGYSTLWIANAIGENGRVTTIEKSEHAYQKACTFLQEQKNIECINADAVNFLQTHKFIEKFDAVFIDADKTNYSVYLDLCLPLLRKGGLIIADNTLMFGEIIEPKTFREKTIQAIQQFNEKISQNQLVDSIILPTNSGLTIGIKK